MNYNKKIGYYRNYYNSLFFSYILPYSNIKGYYKAFNHDNLYKRNYIYSCLIIYPILYKKLSFFQFNVKILKKRRMKNIFNLNQTIILEGTISRKKCSLSVPLFSFLNKIKF